MTNKTAAAGLTTKKIILILGALAIVSAAVVVTILLLNDREDSGTPVMSASNLEDIKGNIKDKVEKGMFMTHMNTTWTFPDGKSPSDNAVMGNSAANNYPFWFTLDLADTDEKLYQSGLIPVGQQLGEIKLDKALKKGSYSAVVTIHMQDENGEEVESNMSFNVSLIVEN